MIDAREAWRIGLVNRVVPAAKLDSAVAELAAKIVAKSPYAVATGKRLVRGLDAMSRAEAYAAAAEVMTRNMMHTDAAEGIADFVGKRNPVPRPR